MKKKKAIPTKDVPEVDERFESVDAAINYFSDREFKSHTVGLGNCRIDEGGTFTVDSEGLELTDFAFRELMSRLELPYNFIQKTSPSELSVHVVNRMLEEKSDTKVRCWRTNGTVETFTSEDFSPIHHNTFLNAFNESFEVGSTLDIRLSKTQLRVVKLFDLKQELKPGDIFQLGTEFINYDIFSEARFLHADAFLYRLICSNGSRIRNALQDYSKMFQPPITDIYLKEKIREILYTENETEGIFEALKWMDRNKIKSHRNRIFKIFKNLVKKHISLPDENPFNEDNTYFDVFNHVTQVVQNRGVPVKRRREVETWAGSLIDAWLEGQSENRNSVIWEHSAIPM